MLGFSGFALSPARGKYAKQILRTLSTRRPQGAQEQKRRDRAEDASHRMQAAPPLQ